MTTQHALRPSHATGNGGFSARPAPFVNVGEGERLASVVGGGLLALVGLSGRGPTSLLLPLVGGLLVYRGLTGHCSVYAALGHSSAEPHGPATAVPAGRGYKIEESILINRPAPELFAMWRQLERLPEFMKHLKEVKLLGGNRSRWVAQGPLGAPAEWEAEIINERENELIAWRSLEGSTVSTAGSVHFVPVSGGRGTEVRVSLKYDPPGGKLGAAASSVLGADPEAQLRADLRRFKQLAEAGETASAERFGGRW